MATRTQAIGYFLTHNTHADLSALYTPSMEVQVNVARDNGEVVDGEYMGKKWRGYTDGTVVWKSFRIPFNAWNDPHYEDKELKFSLTQHAEGIGLTGWDWENKKSRWVAFDFDAITGHSDKHTQKLSWDELQKVKEAACNIPWVTVRKSTSGNGLHLYVFLDPVDTVNHSEHSALARAILSYMTTYTGFDFKSKVDICGGNMWVWHRKMKGTDGLTLIKQGDILSDIPPNWRNHVPVVQGRRPKVMNEDRNWLTDDKESFEQLSGSYKHVRLDDIHLQLLEWLRSEKRYFWWDSDRHMLVTHVIHLRDAHDALNYKGVFLTDSKGNNLDEHNCFAYPMRNGAWVVRRYGQGAKEHPSWLTDSAGFTMCYLNKAPDLRMAAAANRGVEDAKGKFIFPYAQDLVETVSQLGSDVTIPDYMTGRQNASLKMHKDGRLIVEIDRAQNDRYDDMLGWVAGDKKWTRLVEISKIEAEQDQPIDTYDDLIRHVVDQEGKWSGWYVNANGRWNHETLQVIKTLLAGKGLSTKDANGLLAYHIQRPWVLTIKPFQPEYPGDREWNRDAPKFRVQPSTSDKLHYPTWMSILTHIGKALDEPMRQSEWAQKNGITRGADYLKCWIASMIQYPNEPLPYLFLYGERQATGKSMFHESMQLLFFPGYENAGVALTNQQQFNGELAKAVLCVIEEMQLKDSKVAYNRIKEWVTSVHLPIHPKNGTPYYIRNSTHWVHCANPREACPIFPGDTRITMIHVPEPPEKPIPKNELLVRLEKEAPDFLAALLRLELPEPVDRMNIPVIETPDKITAADINRDELDRFLEEEVRNIPGHYVMLSDFWQRFNAWLDPNVRHKWTKIRVSTKMPPIYPKGRPHGATSVAWGNMTFDANAVPGDPYVLRGTSLVQEKETDE